MQLSVTGHHVDVTPKLRRYVGTKLARIERHFDHVSAIHCILTVEKLSHKAEATVQLDGGTIHADASGEGMHAAIDGLVDKLDRQVRKYKEKRVERFHRGAVRRRSG